MKTLLEIARVLTKKKIVKIEILDEQVLKQKDSKFAKFYEGLLTGKIESDKDAALLLYESTNAGDAKYRQLKSRFRRRLLNTLFFLDVNTAQHSSYEQARVNCSKELALVDILLFHDANASAASLCRQILNTALKFHFTEMILRTARQLRELAASEEDNKNYEYYHELVQQYTHLYQIELTAEQYSLAAQKIYQSGSCDDLSNEQLEGYANKLVQLSEKCDTPRLHFYLFYVWVLYYEAIQDYEGMLEVCSNAQHYIQEHDAYFSHKEKAVFSLKILNGYFHLNDYNRGKTHAEETLTQLSEDTVEWVDFMEYYLLLSLKEAYIINAIAIFNKVVNLSIFKKLDKERREKWELFEAMLHYLMEKEGANSTLLPRQRRKTFKLSDFINRTVNYPQHQSVLALQHLILQTLFLLKRKSHSGISERIEQLLKITKYELKKEGYERAYAFSKLLQQLQKAQLDPKNLKNTEKYLVELQQKSQAYRGRIAELEILPYEQVWALILKHLQ